MGEAMRRFWLSCVFLAGCGNLNQVGRAPEFSPLDGNTEHNAMYSTLPDTVDDRGPTEQSSLWTAQRNSLLGDHRASNRGDILTVVVQINDQATINNSTGRSRTASDKVGVPSLFGIPQRLDAVVLPVVT
jgi:flagellar L-ring protein precursor FlgH